MATFVLPLFLIGAPNYPAGDWRRGLILMLVAFLIAPVVQTLVANLARESEIHRELGAQLNGVMSGATMSSLIVTDPAGTITLFSPGAERMHQRSAGDLVGTSTIDAIHDPREVDAAAQELGVAAGPDVFGELARRGEESRIWTYVRPDGSTILARVVVTELEDADGESVGYLSVGIDATQAIVNRRALAASEARWRVLMDNLPDLTVLVLGEDLDIRLVAGSGVLRQGLKGRTGETLYAVSKAENIAVLEPAITQALRGVAGRVEISSTQTGSELEVATLPLPNADGDPEALVVARDVGRDRARERQVLRASDRVQRLFDDAPHGIVVLSTDGVVQQVNPALCAIFGRSYDDVVGLHVSAVSAREDDPRVREHLIDVVDGPTHHSEGQWLVRTADGDEVHVAVSSTLLHSNVDVDDEDEDQILMNVVDISERYRYEQQLAHLADHDPLTGLANRRKFDAELKRHLEHCDRYGAQGALLILDLDNFKEVNDSLGHAAGDQLIVSLADVLRRRLRSTDVIARLGGDEFAILLPFADRAATEQVAQSIVHLVRSNVSLLDGSHRRVTTSVGAIVIGDVSASASHLMAAADLTMYEAKDAGRDQYVLLDPSQGDEVAGSPRIAWSDRIAAALTADKFVLHLQPVMDLHQGRITGTELLIRLNDTDELIHPGRFLYIAERTGAIVDLDLWVIRQAARMLAQLQRISPSFRLEVNVSGRSLAQPAIMQALVSMRHRHHIDPAGLVLEISETAAVGNIESARAFAEQVAQLGYRFAIDDFGAGFGSFYYLKHLLFDFVKIDGEFVAHCHVNPTDRAIVSSIVGIAHGLGKESVAEFVATPEILDVITGLGVDHAQGFHVGRPVPWDDFLCLLHPDGIPS